MQRFSINVIWLAGMMAWACTGRPSKEDGASFISSSSLKERIIRLSSDNLMGRKPFTKGEGLTLSYLKSEFQSIGLEPGNDTSYFQEVPMVEITTRADSLMSLEGHAKEFQLKGHDDYVIWTQRVDGAALTKDELVFAGYGIVAPEYGWNDYNGLDVRGKVVLVLVNDPGFGSSDSTFFKGNTMTYYGRWTYKFEEAARQGAKGCLVIHDDAPASYGFWVVQNSWNTAKLYLDSGLPTCAVEGWISMPAAKKLFKIAGLDADNLMASALTREFKGQTLGIKSTTTLAASSKRNKSYNVIGKVTGTRRPDETIIYTAHWDHLGIGQPDESGDSIYNGALDNASGTAGLIEIANAFARLKTKPERTVVFLAVTAEEQGLLGSAYYTQNPVYPKETTVANINMDGINPYGRMRDIEVIGSGQSDLDDYIADACREVGRYVSPDPSPAAGHYFRSDHFNFAKIGIPALYTDQGIDHVEKGKAYGKEMIDDYFANRYHKPSDEYNPSTWNLDGGIDDLRLFFQIGKRLAFASAWPQWKPGSEFKSIREQYRP